MASPLTSAASRACLRAARGSASTTTRALSTTASVRSDSSSAPPAWTSYHSPFKTGKSRASEVPDFGKYASSKGDSNRLIQYFMVGGMGAITAAGAKSTVQGVYPPPISMLLLCVQLTVC